MNNILVIGDLHCPFDHEGYLKFNQQLVKRFNINRVVFIGDILDGHAWNYHEHDPDGKSAGGELDEAIKRLKRWYKAFPKADVLYGNHDLLISRKAKTAGLSSRFIKDFNEIIEAPKGWKFHHELIIDGNLYIHGSTGNALTRARDTRISVIQGHLHSRGFVEWIVSIKDKIFGLQVPCGIDRDAYAMDYGKMFPKKPILGSGLVLENGKLPLVVLMDL